MGWGLEVKVGIDNKRGINGAIGLLAPATVTQFQRNQLG